MASGIAAGPHMPASRAPAPAVTTVLLAAGLAWAAFTVIGAVAGWASVAASFRAVIDGWAAGPDFSLKPALERIGGIAAVTGLVAAALGAALGAGAPVSSFISPRRIPPALVAPLGLGALSVAVAGLGFAGLLAPLPLCALALTVLAGGLRAARSRRATAAGAWRSFRAQPVSSAAALLFVAGAWILLASLPDTLEDPLVYHWAAPEQFLRQHRITGAPWNVQWHFPFAVEMLYAAGLSLAGVAGIKAVSLAILLATLALVGSLAKKLGANAWTSVVLLALSPAIAEQVWIAKSDLGGVMFWTAALLTPLELPLRSIRGAVAAGAFAGFCASAKFTSVFPLAGLLVWIAARRPGARSFALLAGAAAAAAATWPARNWIATGTPLLPYATTWLQSPWWGPAHAQAYHDHVAAVTPIAHKLPSYWLLAWPDALANADSLGPALAALAPLGLAVLLPGSARAACAVSVLAFLALLPEHNARFLLPLVSLAAVGGAMAVGNLRTVWPRLIARAWPLLLAVSAAHVGCRMVELLAPEDWCALAGRTTRQELLAARHTCLDDLRGWCANRLPAGSRILLTGSDQRFGFRQDVISASVVTCPMPWRWAKEARDAGELAKKWKQAGITHLADNLVSGRYRHQLWFRGPAWDDRALRVYRAFALRHLTEVHRSPHLDFANGMFYLLRVDRNPHAPSRSTPVLPWTEAFFARANEMGSQGLMMEEALRLAREAVARLPDVDGAAEQGATILHRLGDYRGATVLNRAIARNGFDGESGWHELAVEESYWGNRREAFAALRHRWMLVPSFRNDTATLAAGLFVNWAGQRERAGDAAAACRLVAIALRISPGYQPALAAASRLACGTGTRGRPGRR